MIIYDSIISLTSDNFVDRSQFIPFRIENEHLSFLNYRKNEKNYRDLNSSELISYTLLLTWNKKSENRNVDIVIVRYVTYRSDIIIDRIVFRPRIINHK